MRKSRVLNILRKGGYVLSTQIGTGNEMLAGLAARIGFDCLWIDTEHKCISQDQVYRCIQAAAIYDTDSVVRIRKEGAHSYFRPLEDGAAGIMIPHCVDSEDIKTAVKNSRFYPRGLRGVDFSGPSSDFLTVDGYISAKWQNDETFIMAQIEDKEAVDNICDIIIPNGADILFIGPADLKQSYLYHGESDVNVLDNAAFQISKALENRNDMWWGLPIGTPEQLEKYLSMGARFFNVKGDLSVALKGWQEMNEIFRRSIK